MRNVFGSRMDGEIKVNATKSMKAMDLGCGRPRGIVVIKAIHRNAASNINQKILKK